MAEPANDDRQIVISADDARGAEDARSGSVGDTLMPMLIAVVVLTLVCVSSVAFLTLAKVH